MLRWTLENLIDFEQALASGKGTPEAVKLQVTAAARNPDGAEARREGFKIWLSSMRAERPAGPRVMFAARMLHGSLALAGLATGAGCVAALMDHALGGMNVVILLSGVIGLQWLILLVALAGWIFRGKAAGGFTLVQEFFGGIVKRFAKVDGADWWSRMMDGGGKARPAVVWRLAAMAQDFGVFFNVGVMFGLAWFVLTRNVGFYWETTTEGTMRGLLEGATSVLSLPWAWFWPEAVPGAGVIDASRLLAHRTERLAAGPQEWWLFLLACVFVWGLLPRLFLKFLAVAASKRALASLDFQARHHRTIWRELTGTVRDEVEEKPLDGVLVLDVGGGGWNRESLRPFLLRKLRVHPAVWHSVAVLDEGEEKRAAESLADAPAGVVLLAEGWSLSPPRMKALHEKIRALAGPDVPVKFLAANEVSGEPVAPAEEEREQWRRFVDSLRDPNAEIFCFG